MVVEQRYVDRHFSEEVELYYSRCLFPPPSHVTRVHLFSSQFTIRRLRTALGRSNEAARTRAVRDFQESYLGFITIRPIASVPIGRTVLAPLRDDNARKFTCLSTYDVHLLGIPLSIEGLAFQQQDRAAAACATTAIWSALQRVARNEGFRAPIPSAITKAAILHFLPEGRPFPSRGLTSAQMAEALRAFSFPAETFKVEPSPPEFLLHLSIYLRSGIPVILGIWREGLGHAVTAVGYRQEGASPRLYRKKLPDGREPVVDIRNGRFREIYIQDDRVGPYAAAFLEFGKKEALNRSGDKVERDILNLLIPLPWGQETWEVELGFAPLYPKIRSNAEDLINISLDTSTFTDYLSHVIGRPLSVELFLERAGDYQWNLNSLPVSRAHIPALQERVVLSRYVSITRWYADSAPVLDLVWDTTDRLRGEDLDGGLLAAVVFDEAIRHDVNHVVGDTGVPVG